MIATLVRIATAVFDPILAPFGHQWPAFDLLLWPIVGGLVALWAYKLVSNQGAIAAAKDRIAMHLLEIRLFRHSPRVVLRATGTILLRNAQYVGYSLVPMVVMLPPMVLVMTQLVANYAYAPAQVGDVVLFEAKLAPERSDLKPTDVQLDLPAGVVLDAPAVRTPDGRVFWRLRADAPGDHALTVRVGGETESKGWAVGGPPRKVPVLRSRGAEALLYPGEPALASASAFDELRLPAVPRPLPGLPDGELGVLAAFFGLSLVSGFALRGRVGVTF